MDELGYRIYRNRVERDLTQKELAAKMGVGAWKIGKWENDQNRPDADEMARLEKVLGCLDGSDIGPRIENFLKTYEGRVDVSRIAEEAGVTRATVENRRNVKTGPYSDKVMRIEKALMILTDRIECGELEEYDVEEDYEEEDYEEPDSLLQAGLGIGGRTGTKIKTFTLFNPHDEKETSKLPDAPGVYLFYAGENDVGIGTNDLRNIADIDFATRLRMVGTPEYIGETRNIRQRIEYWKLDHEEKKSNAWWYREDWITLAIFVEDDRKGAFRRELETLLIKLLGPQHNKNKLFLPPPRA